MEVATPHMDVREWIYSLTRDENINAATTLQQATGKVGKGKGVFTAELLEEAVLGLANGETLSLPAGTELAVYHKLQRGAKGADWVYMPDVVLAAIWLKRGNRPVEQITVRTTGRVVRRKL